MIRKLTVDDKQALVGLLNMDECNNLQFYEYLDFLSNEDARFGYYGYFDRDVLAGAVYYSPYNTGIAVRDVAYIPLFQEILSSCSSKYLYGLVDLLQCLGNIPSRQPYSYRYGYIPLNHVTTAETSEVTQATEEDISAIIKFYQGKDIMIEVPERIETFVKNGSVFIVKEDGNIVSAALAHSESSKFALIGAVYTDKSASGKKYGEKCCQALIRHLHQKGKVPYLFYDASLAHLETLYRNLSFVHTSDYLLLVTPEKT